MAAKGKGGSHSRKTEITIAVIGLVGVVATGVFSNWNQLFGQPVLEVPYSYRATGNFETELRYFFEVSGTRKAMTEMETQLLEQMRRNLVEDAPQDADLAEALVTAISEESIPLEEIIDSILPIYREHFTLEQLQELNRFYSTEIMQAMTAKMPLVQQDLAPFQFRLLERIQLRVATRVQEVFDQFEEMSRLPRMEVSVDDPRIQALSIGDSIQGSFVQYSSDWYAIDIPEGAHIEFKTVVPSGHEGVRLADTMLDLYLDPQDPPVLSDDDGGEGTLSRLTVEREAGRYYLEVSSFDGAPGRYELSILRLPPG